MMNSDDEDIRIKGAVNATDIMLDAKRKRMNTMPKSSRKSSRVSKGKVSAACRVFFEETPY
jgi:hypothetical protein